MTNAADVAAWIFDQIKRSRHGYEYQSDIADGILKEFGPTWLYENENGNPAISKAVLKEFGKLKSDLVEWNRGDQSWEWKGPQAEGSPQT